MNCSHNWRTLTYSDSGSESGRLDVALVNLGLCRSRTEAARQIKEGSVLVNGRIAVKPAMMIHPEDAILLSKRPRWVSRAALKLDFALEAFRIEVSGLTALDVGASTGGFSQVLLERGAAFVVAIDVGHGQLAPELVGNPRLSMLEGVNARTLDSGFVAEKTSGRPFDIVVADLSFISLRLVMAPLAAAADTAQFVLLIKPQFEVGRQGVREGIVKEAVLRLEAVLGVLDAAKSAGLGCHGIVRSPIDGEHGNAEYLVHLSARSKADPTQWIDQVAAMTGARQ